MWRETEEAVGGGVAAGVHGGGHGRGGVESQVYLDMAPGRGCRERRLVSGDRVVVVTRSRRVLIIIGIDVGPTSPRAEKNWAMAARVWLYPRVHFSGFLYYFFKKE